tara:strand:+ start:936 stop:1583 length:648 start_codon:yes stop_codon:yes gene_type:complete
MNYKTLALLSFVSFLSHADNNVFRMINVIVPSNLTLGTLSPEEQEEIVVTTINCQDLANSGEFTGNGVYELSVNDRTFSAFCYDRGDGTVWTQVAHIMNNKNHLNTGEVNVSDLQNWGAYGDGGKLSDFDINALAKNSIMLKCRGKMAEFPSSSCLFGANFSYIEQPQCFAPSTQHVAHKGIGGITTEPVVYGNAESATGCYEGGWGRSGELLVR